MSATILTIAAFHAIPIILTGLLVGTRKSVDIAAVVMCVVAVVAGSIDYAVWDLAAVGIAWVYMKRRLL